MIEHVLPVIVDQKVENANGVNGGEFVVPITAFGLFLNRKGGIEQATIFEVDLFDALQFTIKRSPDGLRQLRSKMTLRSAALMPWYSFLV